MYLINACLSPTNSSMILKFTLKGKCSEILNSLNLSSPTAKMDLLGESVQCFPLYSILAAVEIYHVNLFSLDVDWPELDILKTIPYDEIQFDIITAEKRVQNDPEATLKNEKAMIKLLEPQGYTKDINDGVDIIFL